LNWLSLLLVSKVKFELVVRTLEQAYAFWKPDPFAVVAAPHRLRQNCTIFSAFTSKTFETCANKLQQLKKYVNHKKLSLQLLRQERSETVVMAAEKRPASDDYNSSSMVVKRPNLGNSKAVATVNGSGSNGSLIQAAPRTSGLQAPVMELTGHSGEVFCAKFDPNGNYIASGSMDRSIS
jgi:hypothetical protein